MAAVGQTWGLRNHSSPVVAGGGYVYFQSTDVKPWQIDLDGPHGVNLGGYKVSPTVDTSQNFIYFQGTDDTLWQTNQEGYGVRQGGFSTASTPFVV